MEHHLIVLPSIFLDVPSALVCQGKQSSLESGLQQNTTIYTLQCSWCATTEHRHLHSSVLLVCYNSTVYLQYWLLFLNCPQALYQV